MMQSILWELDRDSSWGNVTAMKKNLGFVSIVTEINEFVNVKDWYGLHNGSYWEIILCTLR